MQPNPALTRFLHSIPLFRLIEPDEMMDVLPLLRPIHLEEGQVLLDEGEPARAMWVLGKGCEVQIEDTGADGVRREIARLGEGQTVGEMALVEERERSARARVVASGDAHEIRAVDFQVLREQGRASAYKVLRQLCVELCEKLRSANARALGPSSASPREEASVSGRALADGELDAFEPFARLPEVVKLALTHKLELCELDEGAPIFEEGGAGDATFFVLEGAAVVRRRGRVLGTLGRGSALGLVAVIDRGTRSASAEAAGRTRLLRLSSGDFDQLFGAGNRFARRLVDLAARQLAAHVRSANALVAGGAGAGDDDVRIVSTLDLGLDELDLDLG